MVNDIICGINSEKSENINNFVNTFIENKRLTLLRKKCYQIDIGNGHQNCQIDKRTFTKYPKFYVLNITNVKMYLRTKTNNKI